MNPSSVEHSDETSALAHTLITDLERPQSRRPRETMLRLMTHRNCKMINVCLLKPPSLSVICYMVFVQKVYTNKLSEPLTYVNKKD